MIKTLIKRILPTPLLHSLRNKRMKQQLLSAYKYDLNRYFSYSATQGLANKVKLQGKIIKRYHVVEKGLTMPEPRLGFGKENVLLLSKECLLFLDKFGNQDIQVNNAIGVLVEYKNFHESKNYQLDSDIFDILNQVENISKKNDIKAISQIKTSKDLYFKDSDANFREFSASRRSVRNYSNQPIPNDVLNDVLELALNTPSACNRQTSRVHIFSEKEDIENIFQVQNGNRGFGHLTDKLLVITAELGVFSDPMERNQAYIDGGMYAMNLLYSLHHFKLAACILNCSNTPIIDINMRKASNIKESEVFIAMIACGLAPDGEFAIADSKRFGVQDICTFHNKSK